MLASLRTRFSSLGKKTITSLKHLVTKNEDCSNSKGNTKSNKKKRHYLSSYNLDPPSMSFANMEVSNQLKQVFKVIDANGDGKISPRELSQVLFCLGSCEKSKAKVEAEVIVKEMDFNGDGFIDLDEFTHALLSEDGKVIGTNGNEEDWNVLMDAFLIFDADKNGLISANELQKVLVGLGWDKCGLQECRRMIKGVDNDGDGFVDFDEFLSMMKASTTQVCLEQICK